MLKLHYSTMKNVQKLVLVPIEKWEKLGQKNEPVKEVLVKTVPLTNQLPQMKAQVKNHLPQMKVRGKNQLGQGTVTTSSDHQIFPRLSLKKKNKSLSLLYYLKKNKNIKWNKKGEIFYKGKLFPESNIKHLVNHAVHNNNSRPHGIKTFYKILAKSNIPKKLISNKEGRHLMEKVLHERDIDWRPPGRLNKR